MADINLVLVPANFYKRTVELDINGTKKNFTITLSKAQLTTFLTAINTAITDGQISTTEFNTAIDALFPATEATTIKTDVNNLDAQLIVLGGIAYNLEIFANIERTKKFERLESFKNAKAILG